MSEVLLTVCEFKVFMRDAARLLTADACDELVRFLATHPGAGELIPGTGGVRKYRQPASGRGKRGGARVIYYYLDRDTPLYLIAIYAKNEKHDLSGAEIERLKAMTTTVKQQRAKRKKAI